jgi:hypothetical protein
MICPWIACGCYKCPCPPEFAAVEDTKANKGRARLLLQRNLAAQKVDEKLELRYRGLQDFLGRCSESVCRETLTKRAEAGFRLLEERIKAAEGTNRQLIVITHYPTTWFKYGGFKVDGKTHLDLLKHTNVKIAYFGGHVHATDNKTNVNPEMRRNGWHDYCVGGGGGWACDDAHTGISQGFVTGEVRSDHTLTNFQFHMVPDRDCCYLNPKNK